MHLEYCKVLKVDYFMEWYVYQFFSILILTLDALVVSMMKINTMKKISYSVSLNLIGRVIFKLF